MLSAPRGDALSFSGKAMLTSTQNTTLSAIITLRPMPSPYSTIMIGERWHDQQAMLGRNLTDDELQQIQADIFQHSVANINAIIAQ